MGWTLKLQWLGTTFVFNEVEAIVTEAFDLFVDSPRPRSASFDDLRLPSDIDCADLIINKGHRLVGAVAWLELDDVEYLRGTVERPRFGAANEPLSFSVSEAPWKDSALFPPNFMITKNVRVDASELPVAERERIDAYNARAEELNAEGAEYGFTEIATLPYTVPKQVGRVYPIVFGTPGAAGGQPGSPAIMIDDGSVSGTVLLMIAGHAVDASTVTIWGPDAAGDLTSSAGISVSEDVDLNGRTISVVDVTAGPGTLDPTRIDDDWYAEWDDGEALPGGMGDVLELLLNVSSIRLDSARIRGIRSALNRYQLAGYIDDTVTPWEYVRREIMPLIPLAPVQGRSGLYWVLWDPTHFEIVDHLVEGPEVVVDGLLEFSDIEAKSEVRIEYRYRPDTNKTSKATTTHAGTSAYCALAAQRNDTGGHSIQTEIVDAKSTAGAITTTWAAVFGFPPAILPVMCLRSRFGHRRPGDVVRVTIPSKSLVSIPALISAMAFDGSAIVAIELSILTDPIIRAI
jgi:hypothetical protein